MNVYAQLGVRTIINASGAVTRLGGAPMPAAVLESFIAAAAATVPIEELQAAASREIARATGAEAGLVTAGSAAALTLGAAAILTGYDPGRMERLPFCDGFPHEFLVAREQRSGYDHAVRAAGARLVEVGFNEIVAGAGVRRTEAWEYSAAITASTAGVLYSFASDAQPPLEELAIVARRHNLPLLVDAAGRLPPRENLRLTARGADLVAFSGGKAIRGPQSTGILCGRRELIGAAALQMLDMDDHPALWDPPTGFIDRSRLAGLPRHGIGRSMKVSKEEIVALLAALRLFDQGGYLVELDSQRLRLEKICDALRDLPARCHLLDRRDGESPPWLEIELDEQRLGRTAMEVCRRLRRGEPPVYVGHGQLAHGRLVIYPLCLVPADVDVLAERLARELRP